MTHPRDILLGAQAATGMLPVCDHYSGVEVRMRKSLQLQAEMTEEFGTCVFDVTLDCEDGAPVGGEGEHALLVSELVMSAPDGARVGARVHPVDHPSFDEDMAIIAGGAYQNVTALPADNAAITITSGAANTSYSQNIIWHRDCFTFVSPKQDLPGGMEIATQASLEDEGGVSLRFVRGYDIVNNRKISRLDILWGGAVTLPNFGVRRTN